MDKSNVIIEGYGFVIFFAVVYLDMQVNMAAGYATACFVERSLLVAGVVVMFVMTTIRYGLLYIRGDAYSYEANYNE